MISNQLWKAHLSQIPPLLTLVVILQIQMHVWIWAQTLVARMYNSNEKRVPWRRQYFQTLMCTAVTWHLLSQYNPSTGASTTASRPTHQVIQRKGCKGKPTLQAFTLGIWLALLTTSLWHKAADISKPEGFSMVRSQVSEQFACFGQNTPVMDPDIRYPNFPGPSQSLSQSFYIESGSTLCNQ